MSGAWLAIVLALIAAGGLTFARDAVGALVKWRKRSQPEAVKQEEIHAAVAQATESVTVVLTSRAQLDADNTRLRATITEMDERHARERAAWTSERADLERRHALDRAEWTAERAAMRTEVDEIEARLRRQIDEVVAQWQQALTELADLKNRHGLDTPAAGA